MNSTDQAFHDAVLRRDFSMFLRRCFMTLNPGAPYLPNWHIQAIAHALDQVRRGKIKRLIINMPPRHLKSITVTVAFTAFLLGLEPWRRIYTISYANELASKHASDFRSIVEASWYWRAFQNMRIQRSVDDEIFTTQRGYRKSTSISGTLTGLGGDLFIIDDPQKPIDAQSEPLRARLNQWFTNTLLSRLDNKETGAIIVVAQRVHMDDLSGHLIHSSKDWTVLSLPAIAEEDELIQIGDGEFHPRRIGEALHPELQSLASLQRYREEVGPSVFAAQYQQCPIPPGGAMIKREWLRCYDCLPERNYRFRIIQSWDTANKDGLHNDFSVCTTWLVADDHFYLIDVTRGRYDYPRLKATAIALIQKHRPQYVLIEDASTGTALSQELGRACSGAVVRLVPVERDKKSRLFVHEAKFQAGFVHFPRGAAFLPELEAELLSFPDGKHDDQVDSITQALSYGRPGYTLDYVS
jgi:predicted phage terminase large subunit-like protein